MGHTEKWLRGKKDIVLRNIKNLHRRWLQLLQSKLVKCRVNHAWSICVFICYALKNKERAGTRGVGWNRGRNRVRELQAKLAVRLLDASIREIIFDIGPIQVQLRAWWVHFTHYFRPPCSSHRQLRPREQTKTREKEIMTNWDNFPSNTKFKHMTPQSKEKVPPLDKLNPRIY